ncbi:MAG: hypothetical protein QXF45_03130 [Candidatus Caldarchaeum sp.]
MSYYKGRRLEYKVRDFFLSRGWTVVRAAASKPVDLVCIKRGRIVVVECKNKKGVTWREVEPFVDFAEKAGAEPVIAFNKNGKPVLKSLQTYANFKP